LSSSVTGLRSSVLPFVKVKLSSSPCSLTTTWSLKPKNQSTEVLPRAARCSNTRWLEMRRLWHTFCASGINETNATTSPKTLLEIDAQRHQARGHPIDKALITRDSGKGTAPINTDVFLVKMFEIVV